MHLEQVFRRFRTLESTGLVYRLNAGATEAEFRECEDRIGVSLPPQIIPFWTAINGLVVDDPPLEVLPISKFSIKGKSLIFATCKNDVQIAFDTSALNDSKQWSIINADTGYHVTY